MSQRLHPEWLTDPEFSLWVSGVPGDDFVYCKLCNKEITLSSGKSSLRAHAKGIKHSQLAKTYKRKLSRPAKSKSSSCFPVPANHGSQTAGVNIAFINNPSTSKESRVHQTVLSGFSRGQSSHQSATNHKQFAAESSRIRNNRSPSVEWVTNLWKAHDSFTSDSSIIMGQFEKTLDKMFTQQQSMIANNITDILKVYRDSLSVSEYNQIHRILLGYEGKVKTEMKNIKRELLKVFL